MSSLLSINILDLSLNKTFIQLSTYHDYSSLANFNLILFCWCVSDGFPLFCFSLCKFHFFQLISSSPVTFSSISTDLFFVDFNVHFFETYFVELSFLRRWSSWSISTFSFLNSLISFIFASNFLFFSFWNIKYMQTNDWCEICMFQYNSWNNLTIWLIVIRIIVLYVT